MLEFATLVLSLVAIVMYAMKKVFGTVAINVLHESGAGKSIAHGWMAGLLQMSLFYIAIC